MSNAPRGSTSDQNRPFADSARWPVLARLPDVAEPITRRPMPQGAPGAIEYRFDPPQVSDSAEREANSALSTSRGPTPGVRPPHALERVRPLSQRGLPRRESPILPKSNPFAIPRPRLVDSLAPLVRFMTMVILFTAAGIWFQKMGSHKATPEQPIDLPTTAAQPLVAPTKNAEVHLAPAPTATFPLDSTPQTRARVGRADGNDTAKIETPTTPVTLNNRPAPNPPHFLVRSGDQLPRVQTVEPASDSVGSDPARPKSGETPSVAQLPGYFIEIPTR